MWVMPRGNPVSREEYEALLERVRQLEEKLQELQPKRRQKKEDQDNG